ncbi:Inter-alpha-trypsin inhibitor heavy chain H3 precursor [hydrothermal vent metagenome]|uniref:Inter-alpha-trypsin inhibitor heavy chain H3 n=1 Tax=hydrothermal vent metagenome TaxID=652676 RepID=A0A3B0XHU2_9ZZZZ
MKQPTQTKPYPYAGLFTLLLSLFFSSIASAAGLLTPADARLPALKIKQHHVNVIIEDGYAITEVEQVFHNPNQQDLEAVYSFPVPDKAAVAEFTIWIDGKPVTGEVLEKQKARQVYEQEKAAGRETGITEKDKYKTFDIRVSPIRAGQDTRVKFVYLQPAHMDTGIGRYVYPLEEGGTDEQKLSFWTAAKEVMESFSFTLTLKSAYPIEALRLPNQPAATAQQNADGDWVVQLANSNAALQAIQQEGAANTATPPAQAVFTLDKDLLVYWRHKTGLPGSVDLVSYKTENNKRGTFMLTLTPGDDLKPVTAGSDWIFVLDISGSMQGKYATLADGVQRSLGKMRINDRFRIILFNNKATELTSGYINATPENIKHYSDKVAQVQPGNGTNLYAGVANALKNIDADRTSAIVLVTDGVANVGETEQRQFIKLLKKKDIRLFTFIMGNSANRPLLKAMTKASNGFALNISNSDDIVGKILEATSKVTHQSLHGVKLSIKGVKTTDQTPEIIGSLYRGQQLIVFGHYFGDGMADIKLSGKISGTEKEYRTQIKFPAIDKRNPEIERLWAYASIEDMMEEINNFGEKDDIKQAVTDIATEFGLVTDYTSMVVMRDEMFDAYDIKRNNKQRLQIEHKAQAQRAQQKTVSRRVDNSKPMFKLPRPSFGGGGGGAMNIWMLMLLVPAVLLLRRRK